MNKKHKVNSDFIAKLVIHENWELQERIAVKTVAAGVAGLLGFFVGGRFGAMAGAGLATFFTNLHVDIMELINKLTLAQKRALYDGIWMILERFHLPPVIEIIVRYRRVVELIFDLIKSCIHQLDYTMCKPQGI